VWTALFAAAVTAGALVAGPGTAQAGGGTVTAARHHPPRFSEPTDVDNRYFPLVPGTEFVYDGVVVEDGERHPHRVVFTVTGVTKKIHGIRTVVAWDRDFTDGELQEAELAFFAQDDRGNVWTMGEYPEEFDSGRFVGAPSTWIDGFGGGHGGIHMLARPRVGQTYVEGRVPAIEFLDVSTVVDTHARTCVRAGCFRKVVVVDETSPLDPESGHQIKYYAPRVGLVRVGARGGDSQEFLTLTRVAHLSRAKLAKACAAALAMDRRAYRVAKVYRNTPPARGCRLDDED
jgi:hypothetical protein